MSAPPPTLLLPAALVDPAWPGADRIAALAATPAWAALASRARVLACAGPEDPPPGAPGHLRWLATRLRLPAGTALAACAALVDGATDAAWRLDPVHLHVGRDHLVLGDPRELRPEADEAAALAAAIGPLLAEEGLALDARTPSRWYLREIDAARPLRVATRPLAGAIGRNIDAWQPRGEDARRWRRIVNEVQMTWHAHPVNARREAAGRPAVNSVWIEGRLAPGAPGVERDAAARIATDTPGGGPFSLALSDGARLVVDPRLLDAQLAGDPTAWHAAWHAIAADTLDAISRSGGGGRVVLAGDAGWREIAIAPRADWRFWRRPGAASLLAEPSATASPR